MMNSSTQYDSAPQPCCFIFDVMGWCLILINMKTRKEVDEQIDKAQQAIESGEGYHGMSYEEGVKAALEWVMGDIDEEPIE